MPTGGDTIAWFRPLATVGGSVTPTQSVGFKLLFRCKLKPVGGGQVQIECRLQALTAGDTASRPIQSDDFPTQRGRQTGDWSGQRLIQGGCDCRAVCHLRPRSRTLWGVSGHRLPGRPFSFALRAICDMKNLGMALGCPRVQRTPGGATGLEIGAFCIRLAGASPIPMPGAHFLFPAMPAPSKPGLHHRVRNRIAKS